MQFTRALDWLLNYKAEFESNFAAQRTKEAVRINFEWPIINFYTKNISEKSNIYLIGDTHATSVGKMTDTKISV